MLQTLLSLPLTFYSRPFYARIVNREQGYGWSAIALLTLLSFLGIALFIYKPLLTFNDGLQKVFAMLPDIDIANGKMNINHATPYVIQLDVANPSSGLPAPKIILDPDYPAKDPATLMDSMKKDNIHAIVTTNKIMMFNADKTGMDIYDLETFPPGHYHHEDWLNFGKSVERLGLPILVLSYALAAFVGVLCSVLFMATMFLCVNALIRTRLDFEQAMRLAAVAGLPVGVVALLIPLNILMLFALWLLYGVYALVAARETPDTA